MKTVDIENQFATGDEKTAEAFNNKLSCRFVICIIPPCWENNYILYVSVADSKCKYFPF